MNTTIKILWFPVLIWLLLLVNIFKPSEVDGYTWNETCMDYTVEHYYEWTPMSTEGWYDTATLVYKIENCTLDYWKDITIYDYNGDSAFIIFWGDRDSWQWKIRSDKHFKIYNSDTVVTREESLLMSPELADWRVFQVLEYHRMEFDEAALRIIYNYNIKMSNKTKSIIK
jgi:hypothetical protein